MQDLFGERIQPACRYCEQAYPAGPGSEALLLCARKGIVKEDFACRHFRYDPLMRVPRRPLELAEYKAEDFAL